MTGTFATDEECVESWTGTHLYLSVEIWGLSPRRLSVKKTRKDGEFTPVVSRDRCRGPS